LINHRHKICFIHIPRTGGTVIQDFFGHKIKQPHYDEKEREIDHYRLKDYEELSEFDNSYFKFCFTRNVWCKLVSVFFFKKYGTNKWNPDTRIIDCRNLSFREFVLILRNIDLSTLSHFNCSHLLPQIEYITSNKAKIDFIGRFDNFQSDFNHICDKIGIPRTTIYKNNSTNHKFYTEYYDDDTKDIVAKLYSADIKYFNFKFGD
jgi:hypothetical protein